MATAEKYACYFLQQIQPVSFSDGKLVQTCCNYPDPDYNYHQDLGISMQANKTSNRGITT